MASLTVSIDTAELARRLRDRLRAGNDASTVVWEQGGDRVVLFASQLVARSVGGWLICNVDAQTDQTGKQTLQFVYHLGERGDGDGARAAATINAATIPQVQLADRWGPEIQRVLWDGVLDAVEAAVTSASGPRGQAVVLTGFHVDDRAIHVDVLVGA